MESIIRETLVSVLKAKGTTINALSNGNGALQRRLQRQIKEGAAITEETINLILKKFPDINLDWLLTGEGDMFNDESANYSSCPAHEYHIPLLDLDASAGFASVEAVNSNNHQTLKLPKCDGAISIVGHSMEPIIHDGDIAVFDLVHSSASIRPDGIYIVQYTDDENYTHLTVKRVKHSPKGKDYIRLSSDNVEYGDEDVPIHSISKVAKVLYTITKLSY